MFVKWSDGVTKRTRTDTNFDQNVDVTAVFAAASIQISSSGKAALGDSYTFTKLPSRASIWILPASAGMSMAAR